MPSSGRPENDRILGWKDPYKTSMSITLRSTDWTAPSSQEPLPRRLYRQIPPLHPGTYCYRAHQGVFYCTADRHIHKSPFPKAFQRFQHDARSPRKIKDHRSFGPAGFRDRKYLPCWSR